MEQEQIQALRERAIRTCGVTQDHAGQLQQALVLDDGRDGLHVHVPYQPKLDEPNALYEWVEVESVTHGSYRTLRFFQQGRAL